MCIYIKTEPWCTNFKQMIYQQLSIQPFAIRQDNCATTLWFSQSSVPSNNICANIPILLMTLWMHSRKWQKEPEMINQTSVCCTTLTVLLNHFDFVCFHKWKMNLLNLLGWIIRECYALLKYFRHLCDHQLLLKMNAILLFFLVDHLVNYNLQVFHYSIGHFFLLDTLLLTFTLR